MVLSFPGTICAKLSCQLVTLLVQSWDKCIFYNVLLQPVQGTGGAVLRPTGPSGPFRAAGATGATGPRGYLAIPGNAETTTHGETSERPAGTDGTGTTGSATGNGKVYVRDANLK